MSAPVQQTQFPLWMLWFSFGASLILTLLTIGEKVRQRFIRPKLDFQLTREVFFRLTDYGEALFCNAVLLARHGSVLISSVQATLNKTDSPTKSFPLKALAFGEKVRGAGVFPDHYFHSFSPIDYVADTIPKRVLYFCVQEKYQDPAQKAVADFRKSVLDYKERLRAQQSAVEKSTTPEQAVQQVAELVDASLNKMLDLVQLEPGKYQLVLSVEYRLPAARANAGTQITRSSILFTVGEDVKPFFRSKLKQTLQVSALNLLLDQNQLVEYPSYQPFEVVEKSQD